MVKLAYTTLVTFHACHECHQNEVNGLKPIATEYQVAGWHQLTAEQRLTSREFRTPPDRDPRQRARGCGRSTRVSSGRPEGEISILDTSKFRPGLRSPGQAGRSRVPGPGRTSRLPSADLGRKLRWCLHGAPRRCSPSSSTARPGPPVGLGFQPG